MSRTYSFVCKKCKESCWVGQAHFLYKYDYIAEFLHKHKGHELVFVDDEGLEEEVAECVSLGEGFVGTKDLGTCKTCHYYSKGKCKEEGKPMVRMVPEDFGCIYWEN